MHVWPRSLSGSVVGTGGTAMGAKQRRPLLWNSWPEKEVVNNMLLFQVGDKGYME